MNKWEGKTHLRSTVHDDVGAPSARSTDCQHDAKDVERLRKTYLNGSCRGGGAKVESTQRTAPTALALFESVRRARSANGQDEKGKAGTAEEYAQAAIDRLSPVGFSGVSTQTSTFLSVGYSSSREMMLCRCTSDQQALPDEGSGKKRTNAVLLPLYPLVNLQAPLEPKVPLVKINSDHVRRDMEQDSPARCDAGRVDERRLTDERFEDLLDTGADGLSLATGW